MPLQTAGRYEKNKKHYTIEVTVKMSIQKK